MRWYEYNEQNFIKKTNALNSWSRFALMVCEIFQVVYNHFVEAPTVIN